MHQKSARSSENKSLNLTLGRVPVKKPQGLEGVGGTETLQLEEAQALLMATTIENCCSMGAVSTMMGKSGPAEGTKSATPPATL